MASKFTRQKEKVIELKKWAEIGLYKWPEEAIIKHVEWLYAEDGACTACIVDIEMQGTEITVNTSRPASISTESEKRDVFIIKLSKGAVANFEQRLAETCKEE